MLFPDDLTCVIYKDEGEAVVFAGPPAFVAAALPEGPDVAHANFLDYAEQEPHAVLRELLVDMAARFKPTGLDT